MFVDYYKAVDKRKIISDYICKNKESFSAKILDYGVASPRNGGFKSHFYGERYQLIWRLVFYAKEIDEQIYVDFDAFEVYGNLMQHDVLFFKDEHFDFINKFHIVLMNWRAMPTLFPSSFKKLIAKSEKKNRKISRKKSIKILIEYTKLKIKYKI